jgi:hypothetical protein
MVLSPIFLGEVWFIIHRYSVFHIWRGWVGDLSQMKLTSFEENCHILRRSLNRSHISISRCRSRYKTNKMRGTCMYLYSRLNIFRMFFAAIIWFIQLLIISFSENLLYACNWFSYDQGYYTFVDRMKWTNLESCVNSQSKNLNIIYVIGENQQKN